MIVVHHSMYANVISYAEKSSKAYNVATYLIKEVFFGEKGERGAVGEVQSNLERCAYLFHPERRNTHIFLFCDFFRKKPP